MPTLSCMQCRGGQGAQTSIAAGCTKTKAKASGAKSLSTNKILAPFSTELGSHSETDISGFHSRRMQSEVWRQESEVSEAQLPKESVKQTFWL